MDDFYGLESGGEFSEKAMISPGNHVLPVNYQNLFSYGAFRDRFPIFGSDELLAAASVVSEAEAASVTPEIQREEDIVGMIKAKIASHPCYPRLLDTYIDCQKVGAPPEIASLLEEIRRENDFYKRDTVSIGFGADPELDNFMVVNGPLPILRVTYCDMLAKYKSDLARPFDEATTFLNKIQLQLSSLSTGASERTPSGEGAESSDDENVVREQGEEQEGLRRGEGNHLKDVLFRKFGGQIGSLKVEFSKTKKKGKLPKEARQTLLEWWNVHNKWPYPTEGDKIALAEATGLDQKQINNWFVNQRKRHWKASENMQFALLDNMPPPFFRD